MTFLNPAVMEGARLVVRQTSGSVFSTVASSATNTPIFSPTPTSFSLPTAVAPTTPPVVSTGSSTLVNGSGSGNNGDSNGGGGGGGGGGSNSSSLLFFVALGFGVVFTNLWIIVGVKYCFRYNARNRQLRNEDGEPINMENMPRPHRRRREKKLMTIDEVNEKFPMLKYKTWVASRAQEGLPTRGGVSAPPSRPGSIRHMDAAAPELPPKERISTEDRPTTSATATATTAAEVSAAGVPARTPAEAEESEKPEAQGAGHVPKESTSSTVAAVARTSADADREPESTIAQKHMSQVSHDEDDEDDHIDAALPPECMGTSGDTCAICIDTLEDDDDVRGLTCGHAFHAVCLDPWLTTRRACCPLCKADYYTPKPRPQVADGGDGTTGIITVTLPGDSRSNRMNLPNRPRNAFFSFGRTDPRTAAQRAPGRRRVAGSAQHRHNGGHSFLSGPRTRSNAGPAPASPASAPATQAGAGRLFSGLRAAFPALRPLRGQNNQTPPEPAASGANPGVTPSQLEAGVRNPQS
ncbi:Receptor homology region, transmembrane domain-and RING domain-containing protein 3 [Madurella fahalii]|uniref:RING-type E3 ubiquitin transferase n=1 Tax=Madurella fahalii TaxID=1157608 RepID=A0ABQ0FYR6_9PEZI